jgi:hypothetical protein
VSPDAYRARLYAIEWHARLWHQYGVPFERCEAMIQHVSECLDADYYGDARTSTDDPEIARMREYLDRLFNSEVPGPVSFR